MGVTPQEAEEAIKQISVVNLDELETTTIAVTYREFLPQTTTDPAGETLTTYRAVTRQAHLIGDIGGEEQIAILAHNKKRPKSAEDMAATYDWLAEGVLIAWKMTDPGMTVERLKRGFTMERMTALFNRFFNPASRR